MEHSLALWGGFFVFIIAMLAIDLGIFNRRAHVLSFREAAIWSIVWVVLALIFAMVLYRFMSPEKATEFITGYVIEKSLSVDNLFVFVLIFSYFGVPATYKHRVLFWGIIGALVLRGTMIGAGTALIQQFHWVIYIFGAFLVFTAIKLLFSEMENVEPEKNPFLKLVRRFYPISHEYHGTKFFILEHGRRTATPLLLVTLMVATTDFVFALDSIPAIFAITLDPFIVFTANVFAVLGLRTLFFLVAGMVEKFHYLKYGLSAILMYVGVKMFLPEQWEIPTAMSLMFIAVVLLLAIAASLVREKKIKRRGSRPHF